MTMLLRISRAGKAVLASLILSVAGSSGALAASSAGTIKVLTGSATVTRDSSILAATIGQRLFPGDRISTSSASYVGVVLRDDTRISIGPHAEFSIVEFDFDSSSYAGGLVVSFLKGTARVLTGIVGRHAPDRVRFRTATTTIGIRGTDFIVDLENRQ
ncbi:MAG: FecR domain-containing protein [Betaproteobacteria bacterium]